MIGIGARFIDFIDGNQNRHFGVFRMVNRFNGLRHDTVVGCDNNNGNIRQLRTARTHGGKSFMPRRIEERDLFTFITNLIRTDTLRDAARFVCRDIRFPKRIQKCCLPVVDMPHDGDDRRTIFKITRIIGCRYIFRRIGRFFRFDDRNTKFIGKKKRRIGIHILINRCHDAELHEAHNHLTDFTTEKLRQFLDSYSRRHHDLRRIYGSFLLRPVFFLFILAKRLRH